MRTKMFMAVAGLLALGLWSPPAMAAPKCEVDRPVKLAGLNWASNTFHIALVGHILRHGYGCTTESVPGATIPLMNGLGKGGVDIFMELWKDNVVRAWNKISKAGKARELTGSGIPDAIQGWFVPRYLVEGDPKRGIKAAAPGLKSIADLPKYKSLFKDPEQPDKGRFHNCMIGWGCETMNTKKLEAYGLLNDYVNFRPGSGVALAAAIGSAYRRGKPILAYYWGPTWVLGKYDMVMLKEPTYNKAAWLKLSKAKSGKGLKATAYPPVTVVVAVNSKFAKAAPTIIGFLNRYRTPSKMLDGALVYMRENKDKTGERAAIRFLKTQRAVWSGWVPADVAERVKQSLK